MSEAPRYVRNTAAIIAATTACVVNCLPVSLTGEETDSLIWQRLKASTGCKFSQFFSVTTKACEDCAKYCKEGISSAFCPQQCSGYLNNLEVAQLKSTLNKTFEEIHTKDQVIEQMSAELNMLNTYIPVIIAVAICMLVGLGLTALCQWHRRNRNRNTVTNGSATSIPLEKTEPKTTIQPNAADGQNASYDNHEATNNRDEIIQQPEASQPTDRAFAEDNADNGNREESSERTERVLEQTPNQLIVQIG